MKKITKEEFYKTAKKSSALRKNKLLQEIDKLEVDEGVEIKLIEWNEYYSLTCNPSATLRGIFDRDNSNKKFTTHVLKDNSGWYILRIK